MFDCAFASLMILQRGAEAPFIWNITKKVSSGFKSHLKQPYKRQ